MSLTKINVAAAGVYYLEAGEVHGDIVSPVHGDLAIYTYAPAGGFLGQEYSFATTTGWFQRTQVAGNGDGNAASLVSVGDSLAIERNPGTSNEYGASVPECTGTILDGVAAVAVSANLPALVFGISFETVGTTATVVGFLDNLGAAKTKVYTATAEQMEFNLHGAKVGTTFTVTPSVDDDVTVFWRAQ